MIEDPGSFAIVCVKTLRGYFLLTKGAEQEVLDTVAMPVAKALEADPGVLNFPLCWNMCVETSIDSLVWLALGLVSVLLCFGSRRFRFSARVSCSKLLWAIYVSTHVACLVRRRCELLRASARIELLLACSCS